MAQSCRTFDVNRSSYRYWLTHKDDIDRERELLKDKVSDAFEYSNYSAGARTIAAIISNDDGDTELSRYRAGKLMKELGLLSCQPSQPAYKKQRNHMLKYLIRLTVNFHPNGLIKYGAVTSPTFGLVIAGHI